MRFYLLDPSGNPVTETVIAITDSSGNVVTDANGNPVTQAVISVTDASGNFVTGKCFIRDYNIAKEASSIAEKRIEFFFK